MLSETKSAFGGKKRYLGIMMAMLFIAFVTTFNYGGCGGSSSSDDSGSSAPLFSTGVLDTAFDTDGIVTTTIGSGSYTNAVALQPDGKIVLAGYSSIGVDNYLTLARYTITGTLDTTFDADGVVTTTIGSGSYAKAVAVQPDGKIVVAGYFFNGGDNDIALARYDANGSLDTTFDTDGVVTTTISSGENDEANAIALQPDGKILIAGLSDTTGNFSFTIVRYNTNGSLDTTFDTDGVVTTTIGSGNAASFTMALQPDGKIVLAGYSFNGANDDFTLARYNTNGALDTTFDTDGVVTTTIGSVNAFAYAVTIQADGRIVAAGGTYNGATYDFALARYNSNGSLDTTFDADGVVTTAIGTSSDYAYAIAIQSDGKIVAAGYAYNGANYDFTLARYNSNGSLDTTFDTDGVVTTTIGSGDAYASAIAIQSDGKIVVAGYAYNGANDDFALARYWR